VGVRGSGVQFVFAQNQSVGNIGVGDGGSFATRISGKNLFSGKGSSFIQELDHTSSIKNQIFLSRRKIPAPGFLDLCCVPFLTLKNERIIA
jgi:hypothetical protein